MPCSSSGTPPKWPVPGSDACTAWLRMWRKPSHWLDDCVFHPWSTSSWPVPVPVTSCSNLPRPNSGGSGSPIDQLSANTAPRRTSADAAATRSGVSRFRATEDVVALAPHAPRGPQAGSLREVVVVRKSARHRRSSARRRAIDRKKKQLDTLTRPTAWQDDAPDRSRDHDTSRRDPSPRPHARVGGSALHPDARRSRCRRDQGRAARR